jgi:RNA polymerase sigma-70 factor (ECF subfamily)
VRPGGEPPMTVDARVIAAVRGGNAEAFDLIVREFQPRLYRFLFGMVGDAELARDLTQDTFLAAYRALPDTSEDLNLTGWLFQIARNNARSHWRRRKLIAWLPFGRGTGDDERDSEWVPEGIEPPQSGPEEIVIEREDLAAALKTLQRADRECLLLSVDGFSYAEICAVTGLTLPAVKGRIFRARKELRAILEGKDSGS